MKPFTKIILGCVFAAGLACPGFGQITLSLSPLSDTLAVGSTESYNLNVSGLKGNVDYNGPALGGYSVAIDYNSLTAAAQSVTFGSMLNLSSDDFQSADLTTPGVISISETSFDTAAALETAQTSGFTLATITMQAVSNVTTALTIDTNPLNTSLSDENGATLDLVKVNNASLTAIPEPSMTASVLGALAMGVGAVRRRFPRLLKPAA